jgi:hypothetical protein
VKKFLIALLLIAVAATFVNDLGRWVTTSYSLNAHVREIADNAASAARSDPRQGRLAAVRTAAAAGIEVTGFSFRNTEVIVVARQPVLGTWVLGRAIAMANRQPATTPFYVEARTLSYLH